MLCIEPKNRENYKSVINKFYQNVYEKGSIMLAVCWGKMSEGLDFTDDTAWCVIMVGIPFPNLVDPWVAMKKHFLE